MMISSSGVLRRKLLSWMDESRISESFFFPSFSSWEWICACFHLLHALSFLICSLSFLPSWFPPNKSLHTELNSSEHYIHYSWLMFLLLPLFHHLHKRGEVREAGRDECAGLSLYDTWESWWWSRRRDVVDSRTDWFNLKKPHVNSTSPRNTDSNGKKRWIFTVSSVVIVFCPFGRLLLLPSGRVVHVSPPAQTWHTPQRKKVRKECKMKSKKIVYSNYLGP